MRAPWLLLLILLGSLPLTAHAQTASTPGAITTPYPTLENLSLEWAVSGDSNANGLVNVRYRELGAQMWTPGLSLRRVPAGTYAGFSWDDKHAGSVFGLRADTTYEIALTLSDPDNVASPVAEHIITAKTRAEPSDPAHPQPKSVTPATFAAAAAAAKPGDILLLAGGNYPGFTLTKSGTAIDPIVIRASTPGTAVITGEVRLDGLAYVHLEDLAIHGRVKLEDTEGMVVRRCTIETPSEGIISQSGSTNGYFCDNVVLGAATWAANQVSTTGYDGGEGIQLTGPGNVVCHNYVAGFRDCLSTMEADEAVNQVSIDFYGNDLERCTDDGIEADYAMGNVRVMRNRIVNAYTGLSSQPGLGGPTYFVRNALYNVVLEPFKLHNGTQGDVVLHNTVVKSGDALAVYDDVPQTRLFFRNNLFLGGTGGGAYGCNATCNSGSGKAIAFAPSSASNDFDYDGFGAIGVSFSGKLGNTAFSSLATLRSNTTEKHAVQVDLSVFAATVPALDGGPFPERARQDLRLAAGALAVDAGVALANVNDGFAGVAPDLGAYELGAALPVYGPRNGMGATGTDADGTTGATGGSGNTDSSSTSGSNGSSTSKGASGSASDAVATSVGGSSTNDGANAASGAEHLKGGCAAQPAGGWLCLVIGVLITRCRRLAALFLCSCVGSFGAPPEPTTYKLKDAAATTPADPVVAAVARADAEQRFVCTDQTRGVIVPLRRLTGKELARTYERVLPEAVWRDMQANLYLLPSDSTTASVQTGFSGEFTAETLDSVLGFNALIAARIVTDATAISAFFGSCASSTAFSRSCFDAFFLASGARILRSSLTAADAQAMWEATSSATPSDTMSAIVHALFADPRFLYHVEIGDEAAAPAPRVALTAHEVANRIAYGMTGGPPDDELLGAAASGALLNPSELERQTKRIASDDAFQRVVVAALQYYLNVPVPDTLHDADLPAAATRELERFVAYVVFTNSGAARELWTSTAAFPDTQALADVLGARVWHDGEPPAVAAHHPGLLARPYVNMSKRLDTPLILRGARMRRYMLCDATSPPDAAILAQRPVLSDADRIALSSKDYVTALTASATCMGCHERINGLGFLTGHFDTLGRYVESDVAYSPSTLEPLASHAVDSSAAPRVSTGDDAVYADLGDFAATLADDAKATHCMTRRVFQFISKRTEDPVLDGCSLQRMEETLRQGQPLLAFFSSAFTDQSVLYKTVE